jgi:amino acid adenylation domain-containing protein
MIIKKFEDQVAKFPGRTAVKTAARELSYGQLDEYANRVAHAIIAESNRGAGREAGSRQTQQVALFFEHGIDMIVGALGVLKADNIYVPLDISYPEKRLLYLLEDSGSHLILTSHRNFPLAQQLAGQTGGKCSVLNIEAIGGDIPGPPVQREVSGERTAYILYTSGSTGKPKGVYQTLRNMWYYTRNWIERFSITPDDRMSLFTSFTHDGAVQDIFAALLSGACLYPYSMKESSSIEALYMLLVKEKITIWHSVPSLFRFFADTLTEKDQFYDIRWVLLGGEPLREYDLQLYRSYFPKALLANVYGQTESSVSTICTIARENTFDDVSLGLPLDETEILLVDEDGDIVDTMGVGEIVTSCQYLTPAYWRDQESSDRVFTYDEELGRLYWTGDLGRLTAEGFIKMMGRKDFQVKVRGFRVETGEIETALLQHNAVKEVITIARQDEAGDNYLCVYIVSNETTSSPVISYSWKRCR